MTVATGVPSGIVCWDLVERAQQGDAQAFGEIYDEHVDQIYRYIYLRVGYARELAEDLTSDTFFKAWKRIKTISFQGKQVINWLYTIAGNLVRDYFKSANQRLTVPVPDMPAGVAMCGHSGRDLEGNPEDTVVEHLVQVEILKVVQSLEDEQCEVLILRFLMGRTVLETAQIMGKAPGSVKSLTFRAVRATRRRLPHLAGLMSA